MYPDLFAPDAAAAELRRRTLEQISRELPYRMVEGGHLREAGQRPIEVGVAHAERGARW
jgi:hypothetical protein